MGGLRGVRDRPRGRIPPRKATRAGRFSSRPGEGDAGRARTTRWVVDLHEGLQDVAAAAVLISSFTSLAIGAVIFIPKILILL